MVSRVGIVSWLLRRRAKLRAGQTDGHAAVDAMVAMLIVSIALVMSLRALEQADRIAAMADDVRQAHVLVDDLMLNGPQTYETHVGTSAGFGWILRTELTDQARPIEICRRVVDVVSQRSARRYGASSLTVCPAVAAGA